VIIEPTLSVFILCRGRERGWLAALVWHPRLECWLPPGGSFLEVRAWTPTRGLFGPPPTNPAVGWRQYAPRLRAYARR
jgi:hypothetical protein